MSLPLQKMCPIHLQLTPYVLFFSYQEPQYQGVKHEIVQNGNLQLNRDFTRSC